MKPKTLLLVLLPVLLFVQCATNKKVPYEIPVTFSEKQRNDLIDKFGKGQDLYKANCSECHGIFTKGKDKVPNFSNTQLDNYSARFMRHDPKNHAIIKKMSPEQLNDILTFLRYRKMSKPSKPTQPGGPTPVKAG